MKKVLLHLLQVLIQFLFQRIKLMFLNQEEKKLLLKSQKKLMKME